MKDDFITFFTISLRIASDRSGAVIFNLTAAQVVLECVITEKGLKILHEKKLRNFHHINETTHPHHI